MNEKSFWQRFVDQIPITITFDDPKTGSAGQARNTSAITQLVRVGARPQGAVSETEMSKRPASHGITIEGTSRREVATADLVVAASDGSGSFYFALLDPVNSPMVYLASRTYATRAVQRVKDNMELELKAGDSPHATSAVGIIRDTMTATDGAFTTFAFGRYIRQDGTFTARVCGDALNLYTIDGQPLFDSTDPRYGDFFYYERLSDGRRAPRQVGRRGPQEFGGSNDETYVKISGLPPSAEFMVVTDSAEKARRKSRPGERFVDCLHRVDDTAYIHAIPARIGALPNLMNVLLTVELTRKEIKEKFIVQHGAVFQVNK